MTIILNSYHHYSSENQLNFDKIISRLWNWMIMTIILNSYHHYSSENQLNFDKIISRLWNWMILTIILNSYHHYSSENQLDFLEVSEVIRSFLYEMFVSDVDSLFIALIMKEKRFKCLWLFIDSFIQVYGRLCSIKYCGLMYIFMKYRDGIIVQVIQMVCDAWLWFSGVDYFVSIDYKGRECWSVQYRWHVIDGWRSHWNGISEVHDGDE
jgi:hypothetical protein